MELTISSNTIEDANITIKKNTEEKYVEETIFKITTYLITLMATTLNKALEKNGLSIVANNQIHDIVLEIMKSARILLKDQEKASGLIFQIHLKKIVLNVIDELQKKKILNNSEKDLFEGVIDFIDSSKLIKHFFKKQFLIFQKKEIKKLKKTIREGFEQFKL